MEGVGARNEAAEAAAAFSGGEAAAEEEGPRERATILDTWAGRAVRGVILRLPRTRLSGFIWYTF